MRLRLPDSASSLKVRIGVLLFVGVLMAGLGFHMLLITLTRQRLSKELDIRNRSFASLLANRLSTPLLLRDREELRRELDRVARQHDMVGLAVYDARGLEFDRVLRTPARWVPEAGLRPNSDTEAGREELRQLGKLHVREIEMPILRESVSSAKDEDEMGDVFGMSPDSASGAGERCGWVRVVYATDSVDDAVSSAGRFGVTILFAALALWLIPLSALLRVISQPLSEASDLARAIAAGQLERRIPVRSRDELGTLAESLNTMAAALTEARQLAREEAEAILLANQATVAIARGARDARGVDDVFEVVADQLRRITSSQGAALCLPDEEGTVSKFTRFSPPLPWGDLSTGLPLDVPFARRLETLPGLASRVDLEREDTPLARGLYGQGFRVALLVPLADGSEQGAALMLASTSVNAYPPKQLEVVQALASHLGAALGAAYLHSRLQSAVAELEETRDRLERSERLRVAGEMASGVAHDFNNVLGAILGRVQLVRRQAQSGDLAGAELERALEIIERAAIDGADTVRRLRQFGTGSRGTVTEVVDLDAAIRDAAEFTRPRWEIAAQAEGRPILMVIDSVPGATIEGRASEMREAFTNMILNAMDALPAGGLIRLVTRVSGTQVTAAVEDDGVGMAASVQRRIFDPFFTTKGEGGTGLGLSVVYGIVKAAGGEIQVLSTPGHGTKIEITLPLAAPIVPEVVEPRLVDPPAEMLRVMVVDDEAPVRDLLLEILESLGHSPEGFDSAASALAGFAPGKFDLVFTDLGMPGMSGWDLSRLLRGRDPVVPIAIITGWGADVSPEALAEAGADAVVSKPFAIEDIEGLARMARDRREQRAA